MKAACAKALQQKVDVLLEELKVAVTEALPDVLREQSASTSSPSDPDDVSIGGLATDLGKAALWGLIEDVHQLLRDHAAAVIEKAATAIAAEIDRQLFLEKEPIANAEPEAEALLAAEEGRRTPQATMINRLEWVMDKLGKLLDGNIDKKIQTKFRKFGSSLLGEANGSVRHLGVLKAKAAGLEAKIKEKLSDSNIIDTGKLAALVSKGVLGDQLCKDRIKQSLSGKTWYSKTTRCGMLRRLTTTSWAKLAADEDDLKFLQEQLELLAQKPPTANDWRSYLSSFESVLELRSGMKAERGQAVLECICMDEAVLDGIGAARQLKNTNGTVPDVVLQLLSSGPASHVQHHAYEYRRKFDVELAAIRRTRTLKNQATAFLGTVFFSALVGVANFASRVVYDGFYGDSPV
eukprot:SAG31_NODE_4359_length_3313_cov_2.107032_1_plen_406_part_00